MSYSWLTIDIYFSNQIFRNIQGRGFVYLTMTYNAISRRFLCCMSFFSLSFSSKSSNSFFSFDFNSRDILNITKVIKLDLKFDKVLPTFQIPNEFLKEISIKQLKSNVDVSTKTRVQQQFKKLFEKNTKDNYVLNVRCQYLNCKRRIHVLFIKKT